MAVHKLELFVSIPVLCSDGPATRGLVVEDEETLLWLARIGRVAGEDAGHGGTAAEEGGIAG